MVCVKLRLVCLESSQPPIATLEDITRDLACTRADEVLHTDEHERVCIVLREASILDKVLELGCRKVVNVMNGTCK